MCMMSIYDFTVKDIRGNDVHLKSYQGKVLLIVNTATKCGLTPQFEGLETIYRNFKGQPFEILSFPSNQFLNQAPENNQEIEKFCQLQYHVTFPTFAKIEVNGEGTHPLYEFLREQQPDDIENEQTKGLKEILKKLKQEFPGNSIQWNFTKFLVNKQGEVVKRYSPTISPEEIKEDIEDLLNEEN